MGSYNFSDSSLSEGGSSKGGMFISHGTGFVLLLLSICLSVLVGLVVHFASPGQLVCTCDSPKVEVPPLSPEELRRRCVELINGGDSGVCAACPDNKTTATPTTVTTIAGTTAAEPSSPPNLTTPMSTSTSSTTTTAATTITTTTAKTTTTTPKINYRLPTAVTPFHYTIELQPEIYSGNSTLFTFNGSVAIVVNVSETTSNITLHKKDLDIIISSITLKTLNSMSSAAPGIASTSYDAEREFYVLHLDGALHPDNSYEVRMSFHAALTSAGVGLYYSSYKDDKNQTIYLASTLFESNFARKAFPCFDEPALKATFDITLVRKMTTGRDYITLANTDIIHNESRGHYTADIYATTPIMSTYTLAFAVCDFDYLENTTANIRYRTYARPNGIQHADRAQRYGVDLFEWFEEKFDPNYPINKLDNIAVPEVLSGARTGQNWGLVTYHEDILYEPGVSTASYDSWAVEMTSHGLAHQWFGNLVTPKWWWWLWLNEGFTTFFEFHAVEAIYPSRRSTEQFVVEHMHSVMESDSRRSSHPLVTDVESTSEIEASFDDIAYLKGGCIIRMLYLIMGDELFYVGLNDYLDNRQYGVADHSALWNDLTTATIKADYPVNVRDTLDPFIQQMNYPLVTVTRVEAGVLNVRQERFLYNMSIDTTGDTGRYVYRWTIPITYASSANLSNFDRTFAFGDFDILHHTEEERNITDDIILDPSEENSWVIINLHQTVYYRANYDDDNWMALLKDLEGNPTIIPPLNRAQLINDAWALQRAGVLKMEIALRTFNFLKREVDYVPWRAFSREIGYLDAMLERSLLHRAFQKFMTASTQETYNHYKMDISEDTTPTDIDQVVRGARYACKYGITECWYEALRLYRAWMDDMNNNRVHPNLLGLLTCYAVRYGGLDVWNFAYDQYLHSDQPSVKSNSLLGMACSDESWLIQRMLDMALNSSEIDKADVSTLIRYISEEPAAVDITWNFIKENIDTLPAYIGSSSISDIVRDVTYNFNTDSLLKEVSAYDDIVLGPVSRSSRSVTMTWVISENRPWKVVSYHSFRTGPVGPTSRYDRRKPMLEGLADRTDIPVEYTEPIRTAIQTTQTNIQWMSDHRDVIEEWLQEQGFAPTTPPPTTTPAPKINYRLPTAVTPFHYTIELQPEIYSGNSTLFTFNGSVAIVVNVSETTSSITLHKKDLDIETSSITLKTLNSKSSVAPGIVNTSYDAVREFYVLHLDGALHPDNSYEVRISFHAVLTSAGVGLYYSSYKDDNNQTIYLASTMFESNFARKAFPCFDEPALKATFDIALVRKMTTGRDYITLSNTDIIRNESRGHYIADIYATTPIMSTYTLAFAVCDFDYLENTTANITYRTYARPNGIQHADRAQRYGVDLFEWFEEKFDPDYPINKLDNIAVPGFLFGGMENWGLVTYHEDILYEPGVSTASYDSWAVEVTSHEIAHHWFGNLVTPKWWWWLWLNEGFATFFEFHAVEAIYPSRRSTEQFVVVYMHSVMEIDSRRSSHPLVTDVESTSEIEASFDDITYLKGGCIIRMLYMIMGDELFYAGLNDYLENHQYGVADHSALWNDLTTTTIKADYPVNVRDTLDPWIHQMNYPLVTVTRVEAGVLNVRQERFLHNMSIDTTGDTGRYVYRWTIPITYASSANLTNFDRTFAYGDLDILHHTEEERNITDDIILDPSEENSWVIINLHQNVYYRANYDDDNWMALLKDLEGNHTIIPPLNRAQLINDAWALQRAGVLKMEIALRTFNFLKQEVDYVPWRAFSREIGYLDAMLERSHLYGAFQKFMTASTQETYNRYGMDISEDTIPIDIFQIARGASYACKYGVTECRDEALRLYRAWMDDMNNRVDPNLLGLVTCNAVRYGGMVEWNFAYDRYLHSDQPSVKSNSLLGMACARQPWLIERMLAMALDSTKIQKSDASTLIRYISGQPAAVAITWNFIKENIATLPAYIGSSSISDLVRAVSYGYNTDYFLKELEEFADRTDMPVEYTKPIKTAIQTTQANVQWMSDHGVVIEDWLREQGFGQFLP